MKVKSDFLIVTCFARRGKCWFRKEVLKLFQVVFFKSLICSVVNIKLIEAVSGVLPEI